MSKKIKERVTVVNDLSPDPGMTEAGEFLEKITEQVAAFSVKYFEVTEELPFIYAERQFQSVLLPAIVKVADAVLVEQPVVRKKKRKRWSGRIDYWVYYKSIELLIEVKHGWMAIKAPKLRKATQQAWEDALEQLKTIKKSEAKELGMDSGEILKIAMIVVPCYQSSQDKNILLSLDIDPDGMRQKIVDGLDSEPNWSAVWEVPQAFQLTEAEYEGGRNEIHPCVNFVAKVKTI